MVRREGVSLFTLCVSTLFDFFFFPSNEHGLLLYFSKSPYILEENERQEVDRMCRKPMERLCWRGQRGKTVAGGGCAVGKGAGSSEDHLHQNLL